MSDLVDQHLNDLTADHHKLIRDQRQLCQLQAAQIDRDRLSDRKHRFTLYTLLIILAIESIPELLELLHQIAINTQ